MFNGLQFPTDDCLLELLDILRDYQFNIDEWLAWFDESIWLHNDPSDFGKPAESMFRFALENIQEKLNFPIELDVIAHGAKTNKHLFQHSDGGIAVYKHNHNGSRGENIGEYDQVARINGRVYVEFEVKMGKPSNVAPESIKGKGGIRIPYRRQKYIHEYYGDGQSLVLKTSVRRAAKVEKVLDRLHPLELLFKQRIASVLLTLEENINLNPYVMLRYETFGGHIVPFFLNQQEYSDLYQGLPYLLAEHNS